MPIRAALDWIITAFSAEAAGPEGKKVRDSIWRILIVVHICWAWGFLGPESGFATADDVKKQISTDLAPIVSKLETISDELNKTVTAQRTTLIRESIVRIRENQQACMAVKPDTIERERLSLQVDLALQEYQALTGREYPIQQRCE